MPYYDYQCSACEHTFTKSLKIAERTQPLSQPCPKCESTDKINQIVGSPILSDSIRMGLQKPPEGFREVLKQIHKNAGVDY